MSSDDCPHRLGIPLERRPGNALNVEIGSAAYRCVLKPPDHWPKNKGMVLRWIGSGGSFLVFGTCSAASCPRDEKEEPVMFFATIEYLAGQPAAIVALTDRAGELICAGRIEVRSGRRDDLYELGYVRASQAAATHGGRLETYRVAG